MQSFKNGRLYETALFWCQGWLFISEFYFIIWEFYNFTAVNNFREINNNFQSTQIGVKNMKLPEDKLYIDF